MLTIIEVLRQISSKVKKRFPTYRHLVEAGVMTRNELSALERAQTMTDYPVYWVPISWASNLVTQAWENGYMKVLIAIDFNIKNHCKPFISKEPGFYITTVKTMSRVQEKCREVYSYSFVCFPLVYTQVI